MRAHNHLGLLALIALVALPTAATAQSADDGVPFNPHRYERGELFFDGSFDQNPLDVDWAIRETRRVEAPTGRLDFELTLTEPFSTVKADVEARYKNREPLATLRRGALPMAGERPLLAAGRVDEDFLTRYTLGSKDSSHTFTLELHNRDGAAVFVLSNRVYTRRYAGAVPPFVPISVRTGPSN